MTLDELIREFDDLGDWEARCDFLIDLGKELPKLDPVNRTEENRVHGYPEQRLACRTDPPACRWRAGSRVRRQQ